MLLMLIAMALPLLGLGLFWFLPWPSALPWYLVAVAVSVACHWAMHRARRWPLRTGWEAMIGRPTEVLRWGRDVGQVRFQAEIWRARSAEGRLFSPGDMVEIRDVEGLTLVVVPRPRNEAGDRRSEPRHGPGPPDRGPAPETLPVGVATSADQRDIRES